MLFSPWIERGVWKIVRVNDSKLNLLKYKLKEKSLKSWVTELSVLG